MLSSERPSILAIRQSGSFPANRLNNLISASVHRPGATLRRALATLLLLRHGITVSGSRVMLPVNRGVFDARRLLRATFVTKISSD